MRFSSLSPRLDILHHSRFDMDMKEKIPSMRRVQPHPRYNLESILPYHQTQPPSKIKQRFLLQTLEITTYVILTSKEIKRELIY